MTCVIQSIWFPLKMFNVYNIEEQEEEKKNKSKINKNRTIVSPIFFFIIWSNNINKIVGKFVQEENILSGNIYAPLSN